jgi:hypothetical protein
MDKPKQVTEKDEIAFLRRKIKKLQERITDLEFANIKLENELELLTPEE